MADEMADARRSSRDRDTGGSRERKRERTRERSRSRSRSRERTKSKKSKKEKKEKKEKKSKDAKKKHRKKDKSSRESERRKRRRRDEDESESSDGSSSDSGSESRGEGKSAPSVDRVQAAAVVRTLLGEFPAIAPDLLALLQMLDAGETAVISGIANTRVKTLLATLFPLLGLKKLRKPDGAYIAGNSSRDSLLETVAEMLASDDDNRGCGEISGSQGLAIEKETDAPSDSVPSVAERRRHDAPIGPTLPPTASGSATTSCNVADHDDDDDDNDFGPALPGMKGFRVADERVEAEMAQRAKQLEEDEWRRARGEAPLSAGQAPAAGGREAWMTQMPENNKIFQDAMGGAMKRTSGKPAAFRSKEPAAIDSTWFDAPEERERAKRAKLDMELLGYVRPENAAAPQSADVSRPPVGGPSVNESILPAANPEADQDMRRQMDALRQKRGPSLLEQHQQKVAAEQKSKVNVGAEKSTWNRDRDLTARRGLSRDDADRIISASKEISSKFTAPTVTRQFL